MRSTGSLLTLSLLTALTLPTSSWARGPSAVIEDLATLRFERLGHPAVRWDHIPPVQATRERPHQLLVVLVRFPDLDFERFSEQTDQGEALAAHYQSLLFDPNYTRPNTLSHYYKTQSLGQYHLQGRVLPPVTLDRPRAHYGRPRRPAGGSWRNDSDSEGLVEELLGKLTQAHPTLDWGPFDQWDPSDFDGDGLREEADGYLDHLVIIYAGGGQSSCQSLFKLNEKLNPNVGPDVLTTLKTEELECADRIWPHRFMVQRRGDEGPKVAEQVNMRGGAPISDSLWGRDYNMQSEYTEVSTFIHEFGHSLGLPDIYARQTSNSTGAWEVMSHTTDPVPQNLSAWSRLQLGWLKPRVIRPPAFGGATARTDHLRTLDDPVVEGEPGAPRALMALLPPIERSIELSTLDAAAHGKQVAYSGQGNGLNRQLKLHIQLPETPAALSFDLWHEIEAGWDFVYVEARRPGAAQWTRLRSVDPRHMPAKHGHDGPQSIPGFTGLSGDFDGDGKNESNPGCDPSKTSAHGDERRSDQVDLCKVPTWTRASVDLSAFKAGMIELRVRYFTDMAAVERGILLDNLRIEAGASLLMKENFEEEVRAPGLQLGDFLLSGGAHRFFVPHYYLLEYRDPYAGSSDLKDPRFRYDSALASARPSFYAHPESGSMMALKVRTRPGLLAWYANGSYAWSENEPTSNGPGKGYLLAIDAHTEELPLLGWEDALKAGPSRDRSHYALPKDESTQERLRAAALKTFCFVRSQAYLPRDLDPALFEGCQPGTVQALQAGSKTLRYVYEIVNELLPGAPRRVFQKVGELYDYRRRGEKLTWRFRDRSLRALHLRDAPFSTRPFPGGIEHYRVAGDHLELIDRETHSARVHFDDRDPERWQNPSLPFGGVKVPSYGFSFELSPPSPESPKGARVAVKVRWRRQ